MQSNQTALVTGANVGIGKEVARQLAVSGAYGKIYLACRNAAKAETAKKDLEASTGKNVFEVLLIDVANLDSVRAAIDSLESDIDVLIMNAGGGGGKTPLALTPAGVTEIFASNVLGHVLLLDSLSSAGRLKQVAILVGSEAARGVPKLGMPRPALATSSADEFASLCDGSFFKAHKFNSGLAYGQVKYVGAMYMAAVARRYPELRLLTISPGNTSGTEGLRDAPFLVRRVIMPFIAPLLGIIHGVDVGAKRLLDGVTDAHFKSGAFYGSEAKALIGPMVEQSEIFPDLANTVYQDNAYAAVHRFL